MAEIDLDVEPPPLAREVGAKLMDDARGLRGGGEDLDREPLAELRHERRLAAAERHPDEPGLRRRHEHPPDGAGDDAVVGRRPRSWHADRSVDLREGAERLLVGGELAPSGVAPEPRVERGRRRRVAEQHRDHLIIVSRHVSRHGVDPPSAARSFLIAW